MFSKKEIDFNKDDIIELNATEKDTVFLKRQFFGHTKLDTEIHNLPLPKGPLWLKIVVKALRFYQKRISPKLGNRCVFDPSCSRYSELAYREKGFFKGSILTVKRLAKCRSNNGGEDVLE